MLGGAATVLMPLLGMVIASWRVLLFCAKFGGSCSFEALKIVCWGSPSPPIGCACLWGEFEDYRGSLTLRNCDNVC